MSAPSTARTKNGVKVSLAPSAAKACLWSSLKRTMFVMSASNTVVTWAEVLRETIMCSAIDLRMLLMGSTVVRPSAAGGALTGAGAGAAGAGGAAGGGVSTTGAAGEAAGADSR